MKNRGAAFVVKQNMKKAVYFAVSLILFIAAVAISFNYLIFQPILHKQAQSFCKNITFDGSYRINGSGFAIIADNVVCSQKGSSVKIKKISVLYKTDAIINWLFGTSKLIGSVQLFNPDIKLDLSKQKSGSNIEDIGKKLVLSKIIGGKMRLKIDNRIFYLNNISVLSDDSIDAKVEYRNQNANLLYLKKSNKIVLSFKNLDSAILKQLLIPKELKLRKLSGTFNYDLISNIGVLKASVGEIAVDPYFDIDDAVVRAIVDPLKQEYNGKIFVWKGPNMLTVNIHVKRKKFRLTIKNYPANAAFLSGSSKKLKAIFDKYKITGKVRIKRAVIEGYVDNLRKVSITAAGKAYDASFKITSDTPLLTKSSGKFELDNNNLNLTNLKGNLGSSFVNKGNIKISNLFSKPSAAINLSLKLKLDDAARQMTTNLLHDKHAQSLLKYADEITGLMHISIRDYRFRPKPFFPFLINIKDVHLKNYDRNLKLSSDLVVIERKSDTVTISASDMRFDMPDLKAAASVFIKIPSNNPENSSTTLIGSLKADSLKMILPSLNLPYSGQFKIIVKKNISVQFDGLTKKKIFGIDSITALRGSVLIPKDKMKYKGRLRMNISNDIFSYNAEVGIKNETISVEGKGNIGIGNFSANGFYEIKNKYWHIILKSSSIMLDRLFSLIGKRDDNMGDFGEGTINLSMDNTHYKKLVFPFITANITFDREFVASKDLTVRFVNALAKGNLLYSLSKKYIKCDFSYKGINDDLIMNQIGLNGELSAKNLDLEGNFLIPEDGPASAFVKYSSTNGRIKKFPSLSKLLHYLSVKNILTLNFTNIARQGLKFKKVSGSLTLENGVLFTKDPLIIKGDLNMIFIGKYYTDKDIIDGVLGIKIFTLINKIISHVPIVGWILTGKDKNFSILSFSVKGKLNKPKILPLPIQSIGGGLLNIIRRSLTFPFQLGK